MASTARSLLYWLSFNYHKAYKGNIILSPSVQINENSYWWNVWKHHSLKLRLIFQFNKACGITQDRLGFPMVVSQSFFAVNFLRCIFRYFFVLISSTWNLIKYTVLMFMHYMCVYVCESGSINRSVMSNFLWPHGL